MAHRPRDASLGRLSAVLRLVLTVSSRISVRVELNTATNLVRKHVPIPVHKRITLSGTIPKL